jgi:hypothetical protein
MPLYQRLNRAPERFHAPSQQLYRWNGAPAVGLVPLRRLQAR